MTSSQDFGKYQVIAEIGRGGMGVIYKAQDPRLNRMVAIKQLVLEHVDPDKRDEFRERFRREAQLAANLNHQNIISVYDISIEPENSYYVMELLEGHSLRQELEKRPDHKLTAEEFFPILAQTCQGLSHAHDMGLVHRDIKPDNIFLLPGGKVKVTDFGIARSAEADNSNLTKPGVMLGTLSYVSPEQLQDARHVDHRADVYSLAVVAYEVLAGTVPFAGDGLTTTLMMIISKEARPLHEANPEVSSEIAAVVAKGMRKKASDRYMSVTELQNEFERAISLGAQSSGIGMVIKQSGAYPNVSNAPMVQQPTAQGSGAGPPRLQRRNTGQVQIGQEEVPKAAVKPWLSGRTGEATKPTGPQAITQSVTLVKPIGTIGKHGDDKGAFLEPTALVARNGRIVVADGSKRKFQVFMRDGRYLSELKTVPAAKGTKTAGGAFSKPSALAMDMRGRIYAVDSSDHFIRVYDGQGTYLREFQNKFGRDGGLYGVMCDPAGLLYISDGDSGAVHVMSAETGNYVRKVGSKGQNEGQLHLPAGLACDRFGQLFIVDYGMSRISVFSKAGLYQRSWGTKGSGKGQFNVPRGIAIDKFDRVYVADTLNHRVCVFSTTGDYLYSFGGRGNEQGKFVGPADVSIDPESNYLYVADRGNARVQVFEILMQ